MIWNNCSGYSAIHFQRVQVLSSIHLNYKKITHEKASRMLILLSQDTLDIDLSIFPRRRIYSKLLSDLNLDVAIWWLYDVDIS